MSEFNLMHDRVLMYEHEDRVRRVGTPRVPLPRRPRGRHGLAQRLHALADRIDG